MEHVVDLFVCPERLDLKPSSRYHPTHGHLQIIGIANVLHFQVGSIALTTALQMLDYAGVLHKPKGCFEVSVVCAPLVSCLAMSFHCHEFGQRVFYEEKSCETRSEVCFDTVFQLVYLRTKEEFW